MSLLLQTLYKMGEVALAEIYKKCTNESVLQTKRRRYLVCLSGVPVFSKDLPPTTTRQTDAKRSTAKKKKKKKSVQKFKNKMDNLHEVHALLKLAEPSAFWVQATGAR